MSRLIQRADIVDYQTYEDDRPARRAVAMALKEPRRIRFGPLTFLFENRETLTYQVQEIMRTERIVREADIVAEIDTYNRILGAPGELGCVLLVGIDDIEERRRRLVEWVGLEHRLYARLADGSKVIARHDGDQVSDGKLSAVQYLWFALAEAPVALGTDFPPLAGEVVLSDEQRAALQADLDRRND